MLSRVEHGKYNNKDKDLDINIYWDCKVMNRQLGEGLKEAMGSLMCITIRKPSKESKKLAKNK